MSKQRIHVNGIDLVYEECGSGNAIVLLHGFCGSSRYWQKICPMLGDNYRVIMPHLRGHGESDSPEGVYSMEVMADDIAALLDELDIGRVVMFGHSLGGYVTAAFAEKYPDRLSGFGLIHSTALPDSAYTKQKRLSDMSVIREQGLSAFMKERIPGLFSNAKLRYMDEEIGQLIEVGLQMTPQGAISALEGMLQRPDRSDVLTGAKFPVLIVAGGEDNVIPPERSFSVTCNGAPRTTYAFPHILETTFEGAAHMSLVEVSDQLARVMATYLRTLDERERTRDDGSREAAAGEA
ncbi:alpha/beta fold hydrolase [Paenibacillus sp. 2TAB19]|jgi:3-oxoadipate enol-lactonase|uniref:alpha/beta fold hydrolase n=1 Tax=Paenibacillus sp. 2TAB19 TaxID=3233003 RepID=UPI003F947365